MDRLNVIQAPPIGPASLIGRAISRSHALQIARWHIKRLREEAGATVKGKGPWSVRYKDGSTAELRIEPSNCEVAK